MVNGALSLAGIVGVLLSGGFVYLEIGRYATPQVPRTLFDERKTVFAYTAGLGVGIVLSLPFLFFMTALAGGALLIALVDLALLLVGTEVAQIVLVRTHYFGRDGAFPFYALSFRAGVGGVLVLALLARYLGSGSLTAEGLLMSAAQALAVVATEVAGALLSLRVERGVGGRVGSPFSGGLVSAVAFGLLATGELYGPIIGTIGALLAFGGMAGVYRRLREPILARVKPPTSRPADDEDEGAEDRRAFGRTDR
jgi:hypothetical protein